LGQTAITCINDKPRDVSAKYLVRKMRKEGIIKNWFQWSRISWQLKLPVFSTATVRNFRTVPPRRYRDLKVENSQGRKRGNLWGFLTSSIGRRRLLKQQQ